MGSMTLHDNNRIKFFSDIIPYGSTWKIDWIRGKIDKGDGAGWVDDTASPSRVTLLKYATQMWMRTDYAINVYFETETIDKVLPLWDGANWWYNLHEYADKILILDNTGEASPGQDVTIIIEVTGQQLHGSLGG